MSTSDAHNEFEEEARLNRGIITVYEQTTETASHDVGDRFLRLGQHEAVHHLKEEQKDFVKVAVPIAHVELPEPLDDDDAFTEWLNTDVGKLAMGHFFDVDVGEMDVLTVSGRDLMDTAEVEVDD